MAIEEFSYKKIVSKSDMEIMFIIENPDDYEKEFYYAAVKIGLQRGIISKFDFDEEYQKELNKNIQEIVAKENAKPRKPFNFFMYGLYFFAGGLLFFFLSLLNFNGSTNDYYEFLFDLTAYITILLGLFLLIIGLIKKIKKLLKR
jgi:hypothetical protein